MITSALSVALLGYETSHGFVRTAAISPRVRPGDVRFNVAEMMRFANQADAQCVHAACFPELCITGYSCRDMFLQAQLQFSAIEGLVEFADHTRTLRPMFIVSLPLMVDGRLFNVAAVVNRGKVLGFVPKSFPPNYGPFEELRWFSPASHLTATEVHIPDLGTIPIGTDLLFEIRNETGDVLAVTGIEICEDGWHRAGPSARHAANGAVIIFNLSASNWTAGKDDYRDMIFPALAGEIIGAYVYVSCGHGESTADVVWDGHAMIIENGNVLARSKRWDRQGQMIVADVDVASLLRERMATSSYGEVMALQRAPYRRVPVQTLSLLLNNQDPRSPHHLQRSIDPLPFIPKDPATRDRRYGDLVAALKQAIMVRLEAVARPKQSSGTSAGSFEEWMTQLNLDTLKSLPPVNVFIGHSGGRDSTLAMEILIEAYDEIGWPRKYINAFRMPGPASSDDTQELSLRRCELAGVTLKTIEIEEATRVILKGIGHEPHWDAEDLEVRKCLVCQNAQARVRTIMLMESGFMVGTGDLTEGALGWCTYGGDGYSMYHLLAGLPKTLVSGMIEWIAHNLRDGEEASTLFDILKVIISPELVKARPGETIQVTEDEIGPMDLNDFIIYWMLRHGAPPPKIAFLAEVAFKDKYDHATILKWLRKFYIRFQFAQFKRDGAPNGVLLGSVGLSQRGNLRWPSDGDVGIFITEVNDLIKGLEVA